MGCSSSIVHNATHEENQSTTLSRRKFETAAKYSNSLRSSVNLYDEAVKECRSFNDIVQMVQELKANFKVNLSNDEVMEAFYYQLAVNEIEKYILWDYNINYAVFKELYIHCSEGNIAKGNQILEFNISNPVRVLVFFNDNQSHSVIQIIEYYLMALLFNQKYKSADSYLLYFTNLILNNSYVIKELSRAVAYNKRLLNFAVSIACKDFADYNNLTDMFAALKNHGSIRNLGIMLVNDNVSNLKENIVDILIESINSLKLCSLGLCNINFNLKQMNLLFNCLLKKNQLTYLGFQQGSADESKLTTVATLLSKAKYLKFVALGYKDFENRKFIESLKKRINQSSIETLIVDYISIDRLMI